jgi:hypothetical protein
MVRRNSSTQQQPPPLSVVRGEQVSANYIDQLITEYQDNPLIEALPRLWSKEEVAEMLSYYPYYDPAQRDLANELRLHLLENVREFFIPQGIHYEIHLSLMLRKKRWRFTLDTENIGLRDAFRRYADLAQWRFC